MPSGELTNWYLGPRDGCKTRQFAYPALNLCTFCQRVNVGSLVERACLDPMSCKTQIKSTRNSTMFGDWFFLGIVLGMTDCVTQNKNARQEVDEESQSAS